MLCTVQKHFIACEGKMLMNLKGCQLNYATGSSHGDWSSASLSETSGVAWMNILDI